MPEDREVTIYDIAKHLNISAATVSRGLKNNPMINKNTRKKIIEAAKALGYQSNTFASSLRSRQTHTLGVLVPRLNSYFMSSVLAGMESAANRHGYNLIIAQSLEDVEKEKLNAATMFNKRVDGLLVSLSYNTQDINHLEPFFKRKIPVVFFDRVHPHNESTSVVINNFSAAYNITKHLIEQGCKRIMHLGGNVLRNVYKERLEGYQQALKDHNLPFSEKLHLTSTLSEQAGIDAARYILDLAPDKRPDAVFSANDTAAVYCMLTLKAEGLRIPEDVAFAGFNNDPISKIIEPNLTTVDYPGDIVGNTAATSIINHLKGISDLYITNSITLRADLVIRASSLKTNSKR
ncbi:transcriptional regulator, LacI family [Chitinophaga sp. CF118]|uniref:LacI family DNA-binding transcriptional regulator n=1 Tax=Chitinophaga sp. CF118 TaxID=1884367 RepID=UPI0008EC8887|nr:LacI family DNA-binding transcriptional regulator [Chitinophaga sp. CF118]SFD98297.1 transcriptional regulator, LacI family [Chitinophaga sp. CF118]